MLSLANCSSGKNYAPVVDAWNQHQTAPSYYIVQKGDTLYSIAWAFEKDYRDLARMNNIATPYTLHPGQKLSMTAIATPKITPKPKAQPKKPPKKVPHWLWPAKGKVSQGFSLKSGNKGIDISGQFAEPVIASAAGIVVYSGSSLRGYGNLIIIKHNADFLSAYAHNERILVTEGQTVTAGQKIATMGRTNGGQVVLHFEIRHDGKPVNPLRYLG